MLEGKKILPALLPMPCFVCIACIACSEGTLKELTLVELFHQCYVRDLCNETIQPKHGRALRRGPLPLRGGRKPEADSQNGGTRWDWHWTAETAHASRDELGGGVEKKGPD